MATALVSTGAFDICAWATDGDAAGDFSVAEGYLLTGSIVSGPTLKTAIDDNGNGETISTADSDTMWTSIAASNCTMDSSLTGIIEDVLNGEC